MTSLSSYSAACRLRSRLETTQNTDRNRSDAERQFADQTGSKYAVRKANEIPEDLGFFWSKKSVSTLYFSRREGGKREEAEGECIARYAELGKFELRRCKSRSCFSFLSPPLFPALFARGSFLPASVGSVIYEYRHSPSYVHSKGLSIGH